MHVSGNQSRNVYSERFRGYRDALEEFDLPFSDELLVVNDLSASQGKETALQILNMKEKPEAVFVSNDTCAVACMLELKKQGIKIPEDISFAGFNNDPISKVVEPNLTTVNYSGYHIGEVAVMNLIDHLKGVSNTKTTNTIVLRADLVVRESSLKNKSS